MAIHDFVDCSILIVEDDILVALDLQKILDDAGCVVVGLVPSVDRALTKISNNHIDAAVLDVKLDGELVLAVADRLAADGVPFVFVTGEPGVLPERYWTKPVLSKPVKPAAVLDALASVMSPC
jgi:DNA-binding NtrC family response regulator